MDSLVSLDSMDSMDSMVHRFEVSLIHGSI
jgi:hypothetical protein